MATIVDTVVTSELTPPVSPPRMLATPTSPNAPGTNSQNAGRKLTIAGGPDG
ncbi:hypothetical protein D3C78_1963440 [compost metagenome]